LSKFEFVHAQSNTLAHLGRKVLWEM
jgi:hypothetical protein